MSELLESEWSEGLTGLNREQLERGLKRAREHCEWPPSIAEFRKLCDLSTESDEKAARLSAENFKLLQLDEAKIHWERIAGYEEAKGTPENLRIGKKLLEKAEHELTAHLSDLRLQGVTKPPSHQDRIINEPRHAIAHLNVVKNTGQRV